MEVPGQWLIEALVESADWAELVPPAKEAPPAVGAEVPPEEPGATAVRAMVVSATCTAGGQARPPAQATPADPAETDPQAKSGEPAKPRHPTKLVLVEQANSDLAEVTA